MDPQALDAAVSAPSEPDDDAAAEQVAAYLRRHPDFFNDRPDLLVELSPPTRWSDDTIVDMQRFMVESLQGEISGLRDCAQEVIETSRVNMIVQARTHDAALAVVRCETLADLLTVIRDKLPTLLGVDAANVVAEDMDGIDLAALDVTALPPGALAGCMDARGDIILVNDSADARRLFGREAAAEVRSVAVVRMRADRVATACAFLLGSCDAEGFHPEQGTELLAFLARVVTVCFDRLVAAEAARS